MDLEDRKKRQTLKVLLVEAFMSLAVLVTVVVLVLVVSGYSIGSDYKLEQGGLLKVDSEPTGISVIVDGEKLGDTNFSRVVSSTEHEVILEKEGYDTWKKKVNVSKGLLYHLRYPRLFLKERTKEHVRDFEGIEFASVSPDRNTMFLIEDNLNWSLLDLRSEKTNKKSIDTSFLSEVTKLEVKQVLWSRNGKRIILEAMVNELHKWLYVDFDNVGNCYDLSGMFSVDFERVLPLDDSANELLAYSNKELFRIDIPKKVLSASLAKNVDDYYSFMNSNIVFVADNAVWLLRNSEKEKIMSLDVPVRIAAVNFYNDKYLVVYKNDSLTIYEGDELRKVLEEKIEINLDNLRIMDGIGYVVARDGNTINAVDMESMKLNVWKVDADSLGWLDKYLIYAVSNGALSVYDFDGQNKRQLSEGVDHNYPVTITDNKWLYYFSDGALMREWLIRK